MSDEFVFKNGKMLFWRVGPINSVKQKHWGINGTHQPPKRRGIWCFPYPYWDYFFVYDQYKKELPKKFRGNWWLKYPEDFDLADLWAEQEKKLDEIIKRKRPSTFFYSGEFYSHIAYNGYVDYTEWFLWDSVRDWSKEVKKHIWCFYRGDGKVYKSKYAKDHLEVFIPNF